MTKLWSLCHACPADAYFDLPYFTRDTALIFNSVLSEGALVINTFHMT